ncbi:MAG TPA: hypothetical protein VM101_04825 [Flavitalea sp.]|nr:hypothetical protein [Flavitalea sp.]
MKQIALVLLIAATSLTVSAQKDYRNNNRNKDKHDRVDRYEKKRGRLDGREKEELRRQLERINHEYDKRIRSVSHSWTSRRHKAMKIEQLENERHYALNECRAKFYRRMDYAERGRYNRRYK